MNESAFGKTVGSGWFACRSAILLAPVLMIAYPASAADGQWIFGFAVILLAALPLAAAAAIAWSLQAIHRRIRALGLSPGWTLMTAVWAISLLGLLYATGRVKKGEWLTAILEKMPIALAVMLLAFGLFLIFANVSATRSTSSVTRGAWWVARLSALHMTLLLLPTIAIGLAMPPLGMVFLPLFLLIGKHAGFVIELLQVGHKIVSFGFPSELHSILHWLDAGIFCAALYYLATNRDDGAVPGAAQVVPRRVPGGGPAAPRASFGKRGG
jgi:hypothetical protein